MSSRGRNETPRRILRAARALLEGGGAAAVSLEDVARCAGVSRQAVYLHFGSRPGLLAALVEFIDAEERLPERFRRGMMNAKTAVEGLDAWLDVWTRYLPRVRGLARTLLVERVTDEAANAAWSNRMDALCQGCRYIVDRLAEEHMLASPWTREEATDWFWALVSVQLFDALAERGWSRRRYADRLRRVVHAVLIRSPSTSRSTRSL